jgi:hypothetical protein
MFDRNACLEEVMKTAIAAVLLIVVLLSWRTPERTQALSCAGPDAERSVEYSDVVVVGAPVRIDGIYGEVRVERYLKGSGPEVVRIKSVMASWGAFWGQEDIGRRWVFFLDREYGDERADYLEWACSGSSPVDAEWAGTLYEEVLAITGSGEAPVSPEPVRIIIDHTNYGRGKANTALGYGVAGAIAVGGVAVLVLMRRRGWMGR